jgi:hypothetical protein
MWAREATYRCQAREVVVEAERLLICQICVTNAGNDRS